MRKSTAGALFGIALLAILLRLSPLLRSPYWGSDFGEYYALTKDLVTRGLIATPYEGWGSTYPYFPGLFVFNGAFALAGVPVDAAVVFPTPIVAGLSVLPLFLIAARTFGDDLAGLGAATMLAVVMLHVYATSHAIPATLGDFLLLGALLMYLGIQRTPRLFLPALLTAFAVIVTHHLATYVLILAVVGSLLLRAALDSRISLRSVRFEVAFLAALVTSTLAYWLTYGGRLWLLILISSPFSSVALIGGALLVIGTVFLTVAIRRRIPWRFRPKVRSLRGAAIAMALAILTTFSIVGVSVITPAIGTAIRLTPLHLAVFAPTLVLLSISAAGRRLLDFSREGTGVTALFLALVASVGIGASFAPTVLIPFRHIEYLAIPVAVMVGGGMRWLASRSQTPVGRLATVGLVAILVASSAVVAVPPPRVMVGFDESTGGSTVGGVLWVREHVGRLVAGDHRLSSLLFGFAGVHATWDRENRFWHESDATRALEWMRAVPVNDRTLRIDWVVLDDNLRAGLQTSPFQPALPLLAGEHEKFLRAPFHKFVDVGSAQVYFLNWGLT